ncbi:MAG: DUF4886 domain-containing protein [Oscillospiraceae bacterium]|nr:DUF4886 domain-containing protein [Oscillospiraceae bacterium]
MKKRILALLLTLAMVMGMVVLPVSAEKAIAPAEKYQADIWLEANTPEQLLAYFTNRVSTNGKSINRTEYIGKTVGVRVMADMNIKADGKSNQYAVFYVGHYSETQSEQFPVSVVLDLNGHTITDTSSNNRMFGVYAGSKLVITNGAIFANGTYKSTGGTIFTSGKTDVTLDGVRFVSNDAGDRETVSSPTDGGMYNGAAGTKLTIINSELEKTAGSVDEGGILFLSGACSARIENSVLKGGSARRGGSIYGSASTEYTITDTVIMGGKATGRGGNIFTMGPTVMTRCKVMGGTAGDAGGNIYFQAKPVTLTDCVIENGFALGDSDNMFVNGGPITVNGGKITGGFCCLGKATFNGAAVVNSYDYQGVKLSEAAQFNLTEGASIVVAGEGALSTADVSAELASGMILPCTRTALAVTDGVLTGTATDTGYCPHCDETVTWTAYTAGTVTSGHYYAQDLTGVNPGTVEEGSDVVIDLCGKVDTTARMVYAGTLTFISSVTGGGVLDRVATSSTNDGPLLRGNGTLNIYGGSFSGTATTGRGGVIDLYGGGTVNLYNGCLRDGACTDTADTYTGGSMYIGDKATLNMYGGLITGGSSVKNGGNIEIYKGTMNMNGGIVMKGSSALGGNIYPGTGTTFVMNDGVIYGGKAETRGGNLYAGSTSSTQTINGGWITGGVSGEWGGNIYFNNGKSYIYGGKITDGIAKWGGGNLYVNTGYYAADATAGTVAKKYAGNILEVGAKNGAQLVIADGYSRETSNTYSYSGVGGNIALFGHMELGAAEIYGGFGARGYGEDIYIGKTGASNTPVFTVKEDFTGDVSIYFGHANNGNALTAYTLDTYGAPIYSLFTAAGAVNGTLRMENLDGAQLFADAEGMLFPGTAAVAEGESLTWFADAQAALAACENTQYVKLFADSTVNLEKNAVVDINGKNLTVTGSGKLTGFDTENDDYAGNGTVTSGNVEATCAAPNGGQYVAVRENDVTTLHRLDMELTNVSLRPSAAGVYYKAVWQCDRVLAAKIASYGMAVSLAHAPDSGFASDETVLYTASNAVISGETVNGALVQEILKAGENNAARGEMPIYAATYAVLTDGTTLMGDNAACSLIDILQSIDRIWPQLSDTQKAGVAELYQLDTETFRCWQLPNMTAEFYGTVSDRPLKVLTLGHSLAVDSNHMLNLVAGAEGYTEEMIVGTLYHSGCPLYRHVDNLEGDRIDYSLYISSSKTPDQPPVILDDVTMKDAIVYDDWDIIVMQGGVWELAEDATFTNGDIQKIQDYVNQHKTNPKAIFAWHTPWAFATEYDLQTSYETQTGKSEADNGYKNGYKNFNNDRIALYEAIQQRVEKYILTDDSFVYLIPSGTAFENAMSSYMTEYDLHRDYAHATDLGRVIAAYTWYCTLTGIQQLEEVKLDAIPMAFLRSTSDKTQDRVITEREKAVILEAVNNALQTPTELTQSAYTTETEFVVSQPMTSRPNYALAENATTTQLRQTAVQAMRDMLSIQWSNPTEINYNKQGAVSDKDYHYDADTTYCGLPYADGQTNLFVWLEYYDFETGRLRMAGDGQWLNDTLGNTCAGSLMWAWSTVCDSLTGSFINSNMVYKYGCIPVGNYTFPNMEAISSYYDISTVDICELNGAETIYACYAQMLPADAVTSSKKEHAMMVIEEPVVERNADGTINASKSYVYIQDQAAGTSATESKFYEVVGEDGKTYYYSGRIHQKFTFKQLYDMAYIPVTTAEFAGLESYAKTTVSFSQKSCDDVNTLVAGTVQCNYPMSMVKIKAERADGKTAELYTMYFDRADVKSGKARKYSFSAESDAILAAFEALRLGDYNVTVEVTAPNGEIFVPVSFQYEK